MQQLSYIGRVESKGYGIESEMYNVYMEIMSVFTNYEFTYNYIQNGAREDIETAGKEPGMQLIIEPIILPSISNAVFIAMYGDLESALNNICKAHTNHYAQKIKLNDIAGNGIQRATIYLDKVIQINVSDSKEWNELKHWNRVRNILVHNNGVIRDVKDETSIEFLKLAINTKHNKVYLTVNDCNNFHGLVVRFTSLCI